MLSSRNRVSNLFIKRQIHSNTEIVENCKEIRNRNPRNLERLRIARKPIGYVLDKPGFSYWHKLLIHRKPRYISAEISHFENGPILSASSNELGLKQQLYSTNDIMAFIGVGRVLAQRCLESGISEIYVDESSISGEKMKMLVEEIEKNGISIQEPPRYKHWNSWNIYRDEKSWESYE